MQLRRYPPNPNDPPPHVILEAKLDEILAVLTSIREALSLPTETTETTTETTTESTTESTTETPNTDDAEDSE